MSKKYEKYFPVIVNCDCGARIRVPPAQAGSVVPCDDCGVEHAIKPLSQFPRKLSSSDTIHQYTERTPVQNNPFQFSLRSLMLFVLGVALACSIGLQIYQIWGKKHQNTFARIDHSWCSGSMTIKAEVVKNELIGVLEGHWAGANPNLEIRYSVLLRDEEENMWPIIASSMKLSRFFVQQADYHIPELLDKQKFQIYCDYEIWNGPPDEGILLSKNSVFSDWLSKEAF
jgi:hypothetical protein